MMATLILVCSLVLMLQFFISYCRSLIAATAKEPLPVEVQVAILWVVQAGFLDEVPVERVKEYQTKLTEFLTTRKRELLTKIAKERALSNALTVELKTAVEDFKQTWK